MRLRPKSEDDLMYFVNALRNFLDLDPINPGHRKRTLNQASAPAKEPPQVGHDVFIGVIP